ncbi:MAG: allophanate hydrolase [Actinomycetota bacterium]
MTRTSAAAAVAEAYRAIAADGRSGVWIDLVPESEAHTHADRIDARSKAGEHLPLSGTTVAVKGNIDVAGLDTTAGCPAFAYRPERSAAAVRALEAAGAVVVGTTNMDQFATGLVGTRSPYGVCPNAHWPGLISGGSSSGSAVAVAAGLVTFALGTDTAGSGRVPAAANGIVGLKPTPGRISTDGVVPAAASFDCVSVFARDAAGAAMVADLAAASPVNGSGGAPATGRPFRIGLLAGSDLDFAGDSAAAARHDDAVVRVLGSAASATPDGIEVVPLDPSAIAVLFAAGRLLYGGAFVAERYAAVGAFIDAHPDDVDPIVRSIIAPAATITAPELARDREILAGYRVETARLFAGIDVLILPTVPRIPTVAEVHEDPIGVNSMLGTYTNFVNLLDLCALTLPIGAAADPPGRPPTSLSVIGPTGADAALVSLGCSIPSRSASLRSG